MESQGLFLGFYSQSRLRGDAVYLPAAVNTVKLPVCRDGNGNGLTELGGNGNGRIVYKRFMQLGVVINPDCFAYKLVLLAADADNDTVIAAAKALGKVAEAIEGKTVVKELYVKGRLVNIVVR